MKENRSFNKKSSSLLNKTALSIFVFSFLFLAIITITACVSKPKDSQASSAPTEAIEWDNYATLNALIHWNDFYSSKDIYTSIKENVYSISNKRISGNDKEKGGVSFSLDDDSSKESFYFKCTDYSKKTITKDEDCIPDIIWFYDLTDTVPNIDNMAMFIASCFDDLSHEDVVERLNYHKEKKNGQEYYDQECFAINGTLFVIILAGNHYTIKVNKDGIAYAKTNYPKNVLSIIYAHDKNAINEISQLSDKDAAHLLSFYSRHEYDNLEEYSDLVTRAGTPPEKQENVQTGNNETAQNNSSVSINSCDEPGCTDEGTHRVETWDGSIVYYCDYHYKMIEDAAEKLDSESYHSCQVPGCTKEGLRSIRGLNGTYEYYCIQHYNEMIDAINKINGY